MELKFGDMSPAQRAQEALRWCVERRHTTGQLCCVCAAEAIDKTIDGGVRLAGGINEQALKLMDAGEAYKTKYEAALLQVGEVTAHRDRLRDMLNKIRGLVWKEAYGPRDHSLEERVMEIIEGPAEKPKRVVENLDQWEEEERREEKAAGAEKPKCAADAHDWKPIPITFEGWDAECRKCGDKKET